ncbi:MAG: Holliday junction branch migration protein RuvA [Candidatus Fermentithermobacillus carboniphilus]|uniref:Holliday junction branch migration complex subunit RuvA n=1 Tax=Candidatus Fermentithermobacillus carboniphilus TaxID=3085328 RepID=A0AAT9LBM6_9FIRM|nr:MAG: Holliday junction branch migration protein RuvA [Candidatus Fermentithermobacillus carboniphilus]
MITEIRGTIVSAGKDTVTIMVGGVGIEVHVSPTLGSLLSGKKEAHLYTRLLVREDGLFIYGFQNREERAIFDLLLTVKGIGPKTAMGVLSAIPVQEFYRAVVSSDEKVLSGLPGIGRKTAGRIILELRDRIGLPPEKGKEKTSSAGSIVEEACEALAALGYSREEARGAVERALGETGASDLELLLREALRKLARI